MGSRKDKINVDILFDDGMHNVFRSNAAYPILMRRPWNQNATGMLAVNTYDEFLKLVEVITKSYSSIPEKINKDHPSIVVLVGPSGSGKTKIATRLLQRTNVFTKLKSYTTQDPTSLKENDWYNYITFDEFHRMCDNEELFESTMYANHGYGSKKTDILDILNEGKNVITVMDICGAMALKTNFDNVITVYIKRDKKTLIKSILEKNSSIEDKVNRLISIEDEKNNEDICDYVVSFDTYQDAVEQLIELLEIENK